MSRPFCPLTDSSLFIAVDYANSDTKAFGCYISYEADEDGVVVADIYSFLRTYLYSTRA